MNTLLCLVALSLALPALAQEHHHATPSASPPASQRQEHPAYAGMQHRAIKALSAQQIADLRAGKGMSLALAAELNGYPGPAHVLELAAPLGLSEEQKRQSQILFDQMQSEARILGESVIAGEAELDRLFRNKVVSAASLQEATANAAHAHAQLRAAHLRYHLSMRQVLSAAQLEMYVRLRGYQISN